MSARGSGRSSQDLVGTEIYTRIEQKLDNRIRLLCPLKILDPVKELLAYSIDYQEWDMLQTLRANPKIKNIIRTSRWIEVHGKASNIRVVVPMDQEVPNLVVELTELPDDTQTTLFSWALKSNSLYNERVTLLEKITDLCQQCNTPGQVYRLWPELLTFMPPATQQAMHEAKAKSAIPSRLFDWQRPEPWMNDVLAQALILPNFEGDTKALARSMRL
jgi:hypothetical protein